MVSLSQQEKTYGRSYVSPVGGGSALLSGTTSSSEEEQKCPSEIGGYVKRTPWPGESQSLFGSSFSTEASSAFHNRNQAQHNMAYRHDRRALRGLYEEYFPGMDSREVTIHRVVNIVDNNNWHGMEYDRGFADDQWHGGPRSYHDPREYHGEGSHSHGDRRYFDDNPHRGDFRRGSSPPRNGPYSQMSYGRDDLRHQLISSRNSSRGAPKFRSRGQGSGPPPREGRDSYRNPSPSVMKRGRSPGRKEVQPAAPARSGSNSSNRSFSPDRDKGYIHQQRHKSNVVTSHTPSSSVEGSPHSSASSKEKAPASVAETEEVVAASMEPKLTPEEDLKARRLEAIKAKALEIETHYRQDCETFRTVVKMLVAKEPSLDNQLQAPLDENLQELKQRCLEALKQFVKELDEIIQQPDASAEPTGHKTLK